MEYALMLLIAYTAYLKWPAAQTEFARAGLTYLAITHLPSAPTDENRLLHLLSYRLNDFGIGSIKASLLIDQKSPYYASILICESDHSFVGSTS